MAMGDVGDVGDARNADADGRCRRHSVIRLRYRRAHKGRWKTLLDSCPLCVADTADRLVAGAAPRQSRRRGGRGVVPSGDAVVGNDFLAGAVPRPSRRRGGRDVVPPGDAVVGNDFLAGGADAAGRGRATASEASSNAAQRAREDDILRRPDTSEAGRLAPASKAAPKVLKRPKYVACETEMQRKLQESQISGVTYMSSDINLAVGEEDNDNAGEAGCEVNHLANNCILNLHPNKMDRYLASPCSDTGRGRMAASEAPRKPVQWAREDEITRRTNNSEMRRLTPGSKAKVLKRPEYIACETEMQRQLQESEISEITYMSSDINLAVSEEDSGNRGAAGYEDNYYDDNGGTLTRSAPSVDNKEGRKIDLSNNCMVSFHPNKMDGHVATPCSDAGRGRMAASKSILSFPRNCFSNNKYRVILQPNGMVLYEPISGSNEYQSQRQHHTRSMSSILSLSGDSVDEDARQRVPKGRRNSEGPEAYDLHAADGINENKVGDASSDRARASLRRAAIVINHMRDVEDKRLLRNAAGVDHNKVSDVMRRAAIVMDGLRDAGVRHSHTPRIAPEAPMDVGGGVPVGRPDRGVEQRGNHAGRGGHGRVGLARVSGVRGAGKDGVASKGNVPRSIALRPRRAPPRMPPAA